MKQVLMSIRPQYLVNILNGDKTLELRKQIPKGFVGWINLYCTFTNPSLYFSRETNTYYIKNVNNWVGLDCLEGTIPCRFWFDEYFTYTKENGNDNDLYDIHELDYRDLCLSNQEIEDYGKGKDLYAIHIKNLEIFDRPKELGEFRQYYNSGWKKQNNMTGDNITKAPQNFMYCEVEE